MGGIKIDKDKCIGCGLCVSIAPAVFELGDDGKARVKVQEFKGSKVQKVQEMVDSCPVSAIEYSE